MTLHIILWRGPCQLHDVCAEIFSVSPPMLVAPLVISMFCLSCDSVVVLDFHDRSEYEHHRVFFSTLQSHAPELVPERPGPGNQKA